MKHIRIKALLVGQALSDQAPMYQTMVTWKMEDGFVHFEPRNAQTLASGDYFLCGGSSARGAGYPSKSHSVSGQHFSTC
jgi:hypothetical protein